MAYLDVMGKKKDADMELGTSTLLDIPIKLDMSLLSTTEKDLIHKIETTTLEIIDLERRKTDITIKQEELDLLVYNLYGINQQEQERIDNYIETTKSLL